MKVRAEVVGWSLLPGYGGLPGLHHDEKGSRNGFAEDDQIIHHQLRLYQAGEGGSRLRLLQVSRDHRCVVMLRT
jgi:hypothetical protein